MTWHVTAPPGRLHGGLGPPLVCIDADTGEERYAWQIALPPGSVLVCLPSGVSIPGRPRAYIDCPTEPDLIMEPCCG